jgi:hypothetical protein
VKEPTIFPVEIAFFVLETSVRAVEIIFRALGMAVVWALWVGRAPSGLGGEPIPTRTLY